MKKSIFIFLFLFPFNLFSQEQLVGNIILDDYLNREILKDSIFSSKNMLRQFNNSVFFSDTLTENFKKASFKLQPFFSTLKHDSKRPYLGNEYGLIPSNGFQNLISAGFVFRYSFLKFQFYPEFVFSENKPFSGFDSSFSDDIIYSRFIYWNAGDFPEKFNDDYNKKFYLGQSKISFSNNFLEFYLGTNNFWWGPGQWNSLLFSNNAPGFPHISLNTIKPTKTFLGHIEGQILIGQLKSSDQLATQNFSLNNKFFTPLFSDWRFLNGFMLSYNPIFIKSLTLGFGRTFQLYSMDRSEGIRGLFPIFEPMIKEKFFNYGNTILYDNRNQSQQIAIFFNYKFLKGNSEIYAQFGRRDHSLNWREFILNPEHARAYQFGFLKLTSLPGTKKVIQIRGELTHQQESINRILRYNMAGGLSWHTHGYVRGFTNLGQMLGVSIGPGSNIQTIELSIIEDWQKFGILFERLENNQDFYYRAFGQQLERKSWIDWSTSLLFNNSFNDLFISTKIQGIFANNYQWGLHQKSTSEFSVSQNLFSIHSQINLIYFFKTKLK